MRSCLPLLPIILFIFTAPIFAISSAPRTQRCTIPSKYQSSNGSADDASAINSVLAECWRDSTIIFSQNTNYNVFKPITAILSNVAIEVQGNLHLPQNITLVQSIVRREKGSAWFKFSGKGIDWLGSPDPANGWINSYGQAWWDANAAAKGTGLPNRPHLISFSVTNGTMVNFKSRQPIGWNVALSGRNITIENPVIDAKSNSSGFPFNTDGFGVTGTDVRIFNMSIFNGDDAVAIQSGANNVLVQGGTVGYQSHGLSIGSLGANVKSLARVSNITFDDITVIDSVYAARFKSWIGGQGTAKNITWRNIRVQNVTFPIFVTQTYFNQANALTERPTGSSVMMEDFTFANFSGSINTFKPGDGSCVTEPCWYNAGLPGLRHTEAVIIECHNEASCRNFTVKDIRLRPQSNETASVICLNAKKELNSDLGFECRNGTFNPR